MSIYTMRTKFGGVLKILLGGIALIFIIGGVYQFGPAMMGQGPSRGGGGTDVVAKVNGIDIARTNFENAWSSVQERARANGVHSALQYADLRAALFQQLVNSYLVLSVAQAEGVDVSDAKVNEQVDKIAGQFLKEDRQRVLGREKFKIADPRNDDEYKRELASLETSVAQREENFAKQVPRDQIRSQIAQEGLIKKIMGGIKPVTDQDVTKSYDVYKVIQIMLPGASMGGLPDDQLRVKADKIISEAKGGADFAALAKTANANGPFKKTGGKGEYSWQSRGTYLPEVREAIEKARPGEVTPAIKSNYGYFIVKVEAITPKPPANMDKKTMDARRKEITQEREMAANTAFQRKMTEKQQVQVLDPELQAYWQLSQAQQSMMDPAKYAKHRGLAVASLIKAKKERPNNSVAVAKLAQLLAEDGKTKDAINILYPMLEGENAMQDSSDLRMLLGDLLVKKIALDTKPADKQSDKDMAIKNYQIASEMARNDPATHEQLIAKYKQLGRPDLIAAEQAWKVNYEKLTAARKAMEAKNTPKPAPGAPKPATP